MFNFESLVFLLVAGAAFTVSGLRFSKLFKLLKAQKGRTKPIDHFAERIKTTLVNVLGQKAVLKKPLVGFMHALIFWGFIIITIGTMEQFLSTLIHGANFEFVGPAFYGLLVVVQDFFTMFVLVGVAYSFYRRLVLKPSHLKLSRDALFVLTFTGGLMLSIFMMNACFIVAHSPWFAEHQVFSNILANAIGGFGFSSETALALAMTFKWVHMLLVLGFAVYIPASKHLHIIAAGPNTFLKHLPREKGMTPINFEDDKITQYGAAKVTDMSWKDVLDMYSCTECGRCQELCPAWNTQKPLSPMALVNDLKYNLFRNKDAILTGKYEEVTHAVDQAVTEDVLWACTSCRACEIACPVFIEHTDKIYDMRRNLVMMESRFPAEAQTVFKNMETNGTPWAMSPDDREKWADGLNVPLAKEQEEVDVLLWVGCAGAFDDRNKKVLRSLVSLLRKASVRFAIIGKAEQCTGDPARRIGNEYLFQTMAKTNITTLARFKFKKVLTSCPHCFNTLKNEYKDFGGNYDVEHHSQFLSKLVNEGKLKPSKSLDELVTYHDSCYLGRWNGEYEGPRHILNSVPGVRAVEMKSNKEQSLCCGAGGGRMWMEEKLGKRINIARTEQAIDTKASVVAAACPFCTTMVTDGIKAKEMTGKIRVLDVAEILDQAVTDIRP